MWWSIYFVCILIIVRLNMDSVILWGRYKLFGSICVGICGQYNVWCVPFSLMQHSERCDGANRTGVRPDQRADAAPESAAIGHSCVADASTSCWSTVTNINSRQGDRCDTNGRSGNRTGKRGRHANTEDHRWSRFGRRQSRAGRQSVKQRMSDKLNSF